MLFTALIVVSLVVVVLSFLALGVWGELRETTENFLRLGDTFREEWEKWGNRRRVQSQMNADLRTENARLRQENFHLESELAAERGRLMGIHEHIRELEDFLPENEHTETE